MPINLPPVGTEHLDVAFPVVGGGIGSPASFSVVVNDAEGLVLIASRNPGARVGDLSFARGHEVSSLYDPLCAGSLVAFALDVTRGTTHLTLETGEEANFPGAPLLRVHHFRSTDERPALGLGSCTDGPGANTELLVDRVVP
jgi:hypothetical protein